MANDEDGQFYLMIWRMRRILPPNSANADGMTGKCLVMITPDAERTMHTFLGVSETVSVEELYKEAVSQSDYVYIEGYLVSSATGRQAAIQLRQWAQEQKVKTALVCLILQWSRSFMMVYKK